MADGGSDHGARQHADRDFFCLPGDTPDLGHRHRRHQAQEQRSFCPDRHL
jgi:hypothetical protein